VDSVFPKSAQIGVSDSLLLKDQLGDGPLGTFIRMMNLLVNEQSGGKENGGIP